MNIYEGGRINLSIYIQLSSLAGQYCSVQLGGLQLQQQYQNNNSTFLPLPTSARAKLQLVVR